MGKESKTLLLNNNGKLSSDSKLTRNIPTFKTNLFRSIKLKKPVNNIVSISEKTDKITLTSLKNNSKINESSNSLAKLQLYPNSKENPKLSPTRILINSKVRSLSQDAIMLQDSSSPITKNKTPVIIQSKIPGKHKKKNKRSNHFIIKLIVIF